MGLSPLCGRISVAQGNKPDRGHYGERAISGALSGLAVSTESISARGEPCWGCSVTLGAGSYLCECTLEDHWICWMSKPEGFSHCSFVLPFLLPYLSYVAWPTRRRQIKQTSINIIVYDTFSMAEKNMTQALPMEVWPCKISSKVLLWAKMLRSDATLRSLLCSHMWFTEPEKPPCLFQLFDFFFF